MTASGAGRQANFDAARLLGHYRTMARIRAFEETALRGLEAGHIRGAMHPSIGQEAVAAGVCANLRGDDMMLSTHRGHGHTLAKGADVQGMMNELFGRADGACQGKGGSMHIADFGVGMLGANGVVGANIEIATGAAHSIKLKGDDRIVACFFGDGAVNRGPFLEGLNWAKVFGLPVLFVCEDNSFSATTRTPAMTAGGGAVPRAESLDIPAAVVDGNDILAVDELARDYAAAIRAGGGPRLIHARTYRLTGHTATDPATYRPEDEVTARWGEEPMARCRALLAEAGVDAATLDDALAAAEREMTAVYETAEAAPWPSDDLAFADVQDVGDPRREAV